MGESGRPQGEKIENKMPKSFVGNLLKNLHGESAQKCLKKRSLLKCFRFFMKYPG
jgi:hypothetical protein